MTKFLPTLLLAGTALAATPAAAQQVNTTFTGPRVEGLIGYDNLGAGDSTDVENNDQHIDGLFYGVAAGYDFALGGALVGAEAEFADSTGKVEVNSTDPDYFGFGRVAAKRDIYVGLRAGVLVQPTTLVYLKGGYTNAKLGLLARDGETELAGNFKLDGYRVGVGAEQAIGRNTFAKLEYRYSNYSNAEFDRNSDLIQGDLSADADRHQVVAGFGFRF